MNGRRPGRPRGDAPPLTREAIVAAALELLDAAGPAGFTMRALAERLGVTAMAIYHHAKSRDELIGAMAESVHAGIDMPVSGSPREVIATLLRRYCDAVLAHPNLTLAMVADPSRHAGAAASLSRELKQALAALGLNRTDTRHWRDILVDYTHGFAVAVASAGPDADAPGLPAYEQAVARLLDAVEALAGART